jgi:hypothetical protein
VCNVSEEHGISIFRVEVKMEAAGASTILLTIFQTKPAGQNPNPHCYQNVRTHN